MDNEKDDLFKEAQAEALKNKIEAKMTSSINKDRDTLLPVITERVEAGETQWDLLRKMIDGSMTERFIDVISAMPDKDFARNYLKLLEHFKPKITRVEESETEKPDMTINIQTVVVNSKGEKEIIKIEDIAQTEEEE